MIMRREATLKQWKMEPCSWNTFAKQVPTLVTGQIFTDPMGMYNDGTFIRISNIKYVISYSDALVIGTESCLYRLHYKDEDITEA